MVPWTGRLHWLGSVDEEGWKGRGVAGLLEGEKAGNEPAGAGKSAQGRPSGYGWVKAVGPGGGRADG